MITSNQNKDHILQGCTSDPFPQTTEDYFTGGYNVQRYGSRSNNSERDAIGENLIDCLTATTIEYINLHYNNQFIDNYSTLVLGIPENKDINIIKLYPNPASAYFNLKNNTSGLTLKIFNSIGQEVI